MMFWNLSLQKIMVFFYHILQNKIRTKILIVIITKTNNKTHKIIRDNLDKSAMYSGIIKSQGVRYCPSIEDKITKFGDRNGHNIFLEPEGLNSDLFIQMAYQTH